MASFDFAYGYLLGTPRDQFNFTTTAQIYTSGTGGTSSVGSVFSIPERISVSFDNPAYAAVRAQYVGHTDDGFVC